MKKFEHSKGRLLKIIDQWIVLFCANFSIVNAAVSGLMNNSGMHLRRFAMWRRVAILRLMVAVWQW